MASDTFRIALTKTLYRKFTFTSTAEKNNKIGIPPWLRNKSHTPLGLLALSCTLCFVNLYVQQQTSQFTCLSTKYFCCGCRLLSPYAVIPNQRNALNDDVLFRTTKRWDECECQAAVNSFLFVRFAFFHAPENFTFNVSPWLYEQLNSTNLQQP